MASSTSILRTDGSRRHARLPGGDPPQDPSRFPVHASARTLSNIAGSGAREINEALRSSRHAKKFVEESEEALLIESERYIAQIGKEAVEIANRRQGVVVDVPDVEEAIDQTKRREPRVAGFYSFGSYRVGTVGRPESVLLVANHWWHSRVGTRRDPVCRRIHQVALTYRCAGESVRGCLQSRMLATADGLDPRGRGCLAISHAGPATPVGRASRCSCAWSPPTSEQALIRASTRTRRPLGSSEIHVSRRPRAVPADGWRQPRRSAAPSCS
jgi:histone H3/H4